MSHGFLYRGVSPRGQRAPPPLCETHASPETHASSQTHAIAVPGRAAKATAGATPHGFSLPDNFMNTETAK